MDGILIVDKPEGLTSADVVRRVKRTLETKVGHLGTLDPFASGVLPLCLGEGTKIAQFLNTADKTYEGLIRLGTRTDTGDRTGSEVAREAVPSLTALDCQRLEGLLRGDRLQTPPMYSALKREGVPLYKLARRGVEVHREPRPIRIESLELVPAEAQRLRFRTTCSKGTYIRVLAEEIAAELQTVGHLESLRRTRFGPFRIEQALLLPLDREKAGRFLLPPRTALGDMLEIVVDRATALDVRRGQVRALARLGPSHHQPNAAKLVGPNGDLLAVVVTGPNGQWQFARVLGRS